MRADSTNFCLQYIASTLVYPKKGVRATCSTFRANSNGGMWYPPVDKNNSCTREVEVQQLTTIIVPLWCLPPSFFDLKPPATQIPTTTVYLRFTVQKTTVVLVSFSSKSPSLWQPFCHFFHFQLNRNHPQCVNKFTHDRQHNCYLPCCNSCYWTWSTSESSFGIATSLWLSMAWRTSCSIPQHANFAEGNLQDSSRPGLFRSFNCLTKHWYSSSMEYGVWSMEYGVWSMVVW